ncbi:hypothetical protein [Pelomonas sp. Root1217]|uniref:hypothetical protein n=1 Tax=Pelomonas sp. Root1217 TaxID=1736430 RepID=UPI000B322A80|nr:hypothetical protein [Pelomonas sp. Root1217]
MQRTVTLFPKSAVTGSTSRLGAWLLTLRDAFTRDDDERLLCEARDLADLERRLRRLEQGRTERFGPLPGVL